MLQRFAICGLCAAVVALALPVTAMGYTFINIADTTGPFGSPFSPALAPPAINDSGTVAFWAVLDAGGMGMFSVTNGALTTIADTTGPVSSFLAAPSINSGGTVAFQATRDAGGSAIYTGNGGLLTTIVDSSGPLSSFSDPVINEVGTVAFRALLDAGGQGAFAGNGGPIGTFADTSGAFTFVNQPWINQSVGVFHAGSAGAQGIYISDGGAPSLVLGTTSGPFINLESPVINDFGTIIFAANTAVTGGLFTYDTVNGGPATTIALVGATFQQISNPGGTAAYSVNNLGNVAFLATLTGGAYGIFTGSNPATDTVIKTGNPLFGSTVTTILPSNNLLNDPGDIGFYYELANGVKGVAVAATAVGSSQYKPFLPNVVDQTGFTFVSANSDQWFDPPLVDQFDFTIEPGSLFTLATLPIGFDSDFEILVNSISLGFFGGGDSVDFITLLGDGVSSFTVQGINPLVDADDVLGFPIYLEFSTPTATFTMTPIPEPASALLLALPAFVFAVRRSRPRSFRRSGR